MHLLAITSVNMAGKCANRKSLQLRLRGFLTITIIALVVAVACLVDETESARDTKRSAKSVKSNKDKVREIFHISVIERTSLQQVA